MASFVRELTAPLRALFTTRQVQPPSQFYVTRTDLLSIVTRCSHATTRVDVRMRLLTPDGELRSLRYDVLPNSDRTQREDIFDMAEGYLLSALAVPTAADVQPGQLYVALYLTRGAAPAALWHQLLSAGFASSGFAVSYPYNDSLVGRGAREWDRVITGTDPAAGVEISETVPTGATWDMVTVTFSLTTDATVASRVISLLMDDGASQVSWNRAIAAQPASTTRSYWAGAQLQDDSANSGRIGMGSLNDRVLSQGWRLLTSGFNLQPGDNYSAPVLWVRESLVD